MRFTGSLAGLSFNKARPNFTPESIAGLELWMDGDDQSTMTINGSNQITAWNDKSSNAIAFTRSAANAPVMTSSAFGSKSAPSFASSKTLIADDNALQGLAAMSVFAVVKPLNQSVSQAGGSVTPIGEYLQIGNWSTNAVEFGGNFPGHTATNGAKHISSVALTSGISCDQTNFGWRAGKDNDAFVTGSATGTSGTSIYRGKKQVRTSLLGGGASAATDISPSTAGVSVDDLCIGGVRSGSSVFGRVNGYIAEVVVYNKVLSEAERFAVVGYLERKWGIVSVKPSIHAIVFGQSNVITTDVLKSAAPSEFTSPTSGSNVSNLGVFVHDLDTNINIPSATEYGPEQRLARELHTNTRKPVIVTKYAVGGSNVASWTGPSGSNYTTLETRINAILDDIEGFGYSFAADDILIYIQLGETDGRDSGLASALATNLGSCLDYLRDNLGLGNAATVVLAQIYKDAPTITYRATIRSNTIIAAAADDNAYVVNTDAMTTSDNLHWDAASVDDIAIAAASAFINQQDTTA